MQHRFVDFACTSIIFITIMIQGYCLNCENILQPDDQFCSQCGQNAHVHPITFSHFIHDATHFFTHADKGIFALLKGLTFRPGFVAREYLAGKRKKYMSPLNFFLIMVGLFVFTLTTFHTMDQPSQYEAMRKNAESQKDPVVKQRRLDKTKRAEQANNFMAKNSNFVSLLFATPLITLVFFIFYRKAGYNYMEHLAINFYFSGFGSLIFIVLIAPMVRLVNRPTFVIVAIGIFLFLEVLYRSLAYYQFMKRRGGIAYTKAFLVSFLSIILWSALSTTFIQLYIDYGIPKW